MTLRRTARLGQQLLREISLKIHNSVRDPDVGGLSVTGVDLGTDLWLARVYVVPSGSPEEQKRTMAALARAAPFLRSSLGRELHIRRMPELRFERDDSLEAAQRIDNILREVMPGDSLGEAPSGDPSEPTES